MPCSGWAPNGNDNADNGDSVDTDCDDDDVFEVFSGDGDRSIDEVYFNDELEWFEIDEIDDEEASPSWSTPPWDKSVVASLDRWWP